MDLLTKAIVFATEKHEGSTRKGTDIPYIVHPLEAVAIAASITTDEKVLCAAVLHDVVEDTTATVKDIEREFGKEVALLVASDSENKRKDVPPSESWEIRKAETLAFLENATRNEQIVCLSDKLSNMRAIYRDYSALGDELFLRFNVKEKEKHGWYYKGVAKRLTLLTDTKAYEEFLALTERVFGV
ncbi:MAG: HD domain-containing protein [Clostridia bacterium]|nr:HD domain-containing protein [Clostridia bacterium]